MWPQFRDAVEEKCRRVVWCEKEEISVDDKQDMPRY